MNIATCIGCGCDDNRACEMGCYWRRVDRAENKGVCSECHEHVEAWDRGDRTPRAQPIAEIEAEMRGEIRFPRPEQPKPPDGCQRDHDWPFEDVQDDDCCRWCGMSFLRHIFTECP
jgi:hypothetical protein